MISRRSPPPATGAQALHHRGTAVAASVPDAGLGEGEGDGDDPAAPPLSGASLLATHAENWPMILSAR
jgi:hypothetical protein